MKKEPCLICGEQTYTQFASVTCDKCKAASPRRKHYDVHLYCLVRVKVENVEASSQQEAIAKAEQNINPSHMFDTSNNDGCEVAFADEIPEALVDEVGDTEYENTTFYDSVSGKWVESKTVGGELRRHKEESVG